MRVPWHGSLICALVILVVAALGSSASAQQRSAGPGRGSLPGERGTSGRAPAAQPPRPDHVSEQLEAKLKRMAEELDQPVPKREYKVTQREAKKTKLFRADPKLLENKFIASFAVIFEPKVANEGDVGLGGDRGGDRGGFGFRDIRQTDRQFAMTPRGPAFGRGEEKYPEDLLRLVQWQGQTMFQPGNYFEESRQKLSEHFGLLAAKCDPQLRPAPPLIEFLTSADCDRDVQRRAGYPNDKGGRYEDGWEFTIYAPTAEAAQQRAAAILQLLDCGISRPMQRYFLAEARKSIEPALATFADYAKEMTTLRAEEEKLAKPSEISPDILSQLKAQRVMVAVELSGLNARVKACDEMLKDPKKLEISTLQSVSDMKVKAEIERVGIKEKLDQINTFIGEGDGREDTRNRIESIKVTANRLWQSARGHESRVTTMSQLYDLYSPLPLNGGEIVVAPVEWTN
jgi:hypothetical protein